MRGNHERQLQYRRWQKRTRFQFVRWGQRMGDSVLVDGLNGALTDPFGKVLMGVTAENVADRHAVTREAQDALAVESHRRAAAAITAGHFRDQIVPIELQVRRKPILFERDEHVRSDTSLDGMRHCGPCSAPVVR